jgi:hypothetical protein
VVQRQTVYIVSLYNSVAQRARPVFAAVGLLLLLLLQSDVPGSAVAAVFPLSCTSR